MNTREVAEIANLTTASVLLAVKNGDLKGSQNEKKRWTFTKPQVDKWIELRGDSATPKKQERDVSGAVDDAIIYLRKALLVAERSPAALKKLRPAFLLVELALTTLQGDL